MAVSALKKKTIAKVITAVGAVMLVVGGYGVPMCSYGTLVEQSRSMVENFINQTMVGAGAQKFSVDFYEDDFGLFSHDLTFIATDGDVKVKIPLKVSINFGGYDFEADLVHATINDGNAIKSFELNTLTAVSLKGSYSLFTENGSAQLDASYLNDDVSLYTLAEYQKYLRQQMAGGDPKSSPNPEFADLAPNLDQAVTQIKERIGYKPVGTMSVNLGFDLAENFTVDFTVDHLLAHYAAVTELNYYSETQGFFELKNIGRNDLTVKRFSLLGFAPTVVEDLTLKTQSSHPSKQGYFDLPYELKIGSARQLKNLSFSGELANVNMQMFQAPEAVLFDLTKLLPQPLTLTVDPGSHFDFVTMVKPDEYHGPEAQQVAFKVDGSATFSALDDGAYGQYIDVVSHANVSANTNVQLITDRAMLPFAPLFAQFKVKDGVSTAVIDVHSGKPSEPTSISVNNNKL